MNGYAQYTRNKVNSGIVASSSNETLLLTSTGDVLVCRDYNSYADCAEHQNADSLGRDGFSTPRGTVDCSNLNGTSSKSKISVSENSINEGTRSLGRRDGNGACCDGDARLCKVLCGGAEDYHSSSEKEKCLALHPTTDLGNSVHHNGWFNKKYDQEGKSEWISRASLTDAKKDRRPRQITQKITSEDLVQPTVENLNGVSEYSSQYLNKNYNCKLAKQTNYVSDQTVETDAHRGKTSLSNENEEEYDVFDIDGIKLGDHGHLITTGSESPTPIMSFDYSFFELTPEGTQSFDNGNGIEDDSKGKTKGDQVKNIIMPKLKHDRDNDNLTQENNTSPISDVSPKTNLMQPHSIDSRTQNHLHGSDQLSSSSHPNCFDPNIFLPGVPTFLNHLAQIRITRISAHPRGQHVLLVSDQGLLFSYGSNNHGQLGVGMQAPKCNTPQLITPLLENGGKSISCAAGLDYSLVVVRTEGARIAHRRRQQQQHQQQQSNQSPNNVVSFKNVDNECFAYHQMYGFGSNAHLKLGLLDPDKLLHGASIGGKSRRRRRGNLTEKSPTNFSPQSLSPSSASSPFISLDSFGDESSDGDSVAVSTDVFLPRRVALHSKVFLKKPTTEMQKRQYHSEIADRSPPYGIFKVEASIDHSAALVRRPNGTVELYTWGRGDFGALGLPLSNQMDQEASNSLRWESFCCIEDNDEYMRSNSLNLTAETSPRELVSRPLRIVPFPTVVSSLTFVQDKDKTAHPPIPKKNQTSRVDCAPPRSPLKTQSRNHLLRTPNTNEKEKSFLSETEYLEEISLGPSSTHVITSMGRLLTFGTSLDGLLALGDDVCTTFEPSEVKFSKFKEDKIVGCKKIASISVGQKHAVAVTNDGKAYTWGKTDNGAMGHPHISFLTTPHPVSQFEKSTYREKFERTTQHLLKENCGEKRFGSYDMGLVAYAHAGLDLTVFIMRSGSVFTCGRKSGRLGQGASYIDIPSPTQMFGGIQLWHLENTLANT